MTEESSLYEKGNSNRAGNENGFAFGRITKVYPEERLCEVKTFMGSGSMDDNHIPKCQWISMDANPEGDESTSIPRINSFGLVFYVQGEPFIFGFFSPLTGTGSAQVGDGKEELNEGDKTLKTVGGNAIIMRSGGIIEIRASDTCHRIYFPDEKTIRDLCRNYEFVADGGTVDWKTKNGGNDTLFKKEYRANVNRENIIIEERGTVGGDIISRTLIGAGDGTTVSQPVWSRTIKKDGETETFIREAGASTGYKRTVKPDGSAQTDFNGKATVTTGNDGTISIDIGPGKITINLDAAGAITLESTGDISAKTAGTFTVEGKLGKIKTKDVELGDGTLEKVLTTPATKSHFSGLPLQPGSSTVKATT